MNFSLFQTHLAYCLIALKRLLFQQAEVVMRQPQSPKNRDSQLQNLFRLLAAP
jgi:hypothetical protein